MKPIENVLEALQKKLYLQKYYHPSQLYRFSVNEVAPPPSRSWKGMQVDLLKIGNSIWRDLMEVLCSERRYCLFSDITVNKDKILSSILDFTVLHPVLQALAQNEEVP